MIGRVTRQGGLPGLPGRATLSAGVVRLHVNAFYFSTTARRVTSPTWDPPPPCKQTLTYLKPSKKSEKRRTKYNDRNRGYFWWPGMDGAIEDRDSACPVCASVGKPPPKAPLHSWKWPAKLWERVHIDFFEMDCSWLSLMHTPYGKKWSLNEHQTSLKTEIEALPTLFARRYPRRKQNGVKFMPVPPIILRQTELHNVQHRRPN